MFVANVERIADAVRNDQQWTLFGEVFGALKQIDARLQDRAATPARFHFAVDGIGWHIALIVGSRVAEDNARWDHHGRCCSWQSPPEPLPTASGRSSWRCLAARRRCAHLSSRAPAPSAGVECRAWQVGGGLVVRRNEPSPAVGSGGRTSVPTLHPTGSAAGSACVSPPLARQGVDAAP
jgi:hypothetical protein